MMNGLDRWLFKCLIMKLRGLGICVTSQLHSIVLLILSIHVVYFHRSLYLGSVAEKRGRSIHISDLEELLTGCSQLEVRHTNS